jgi:hypothetical protein
MFTLLLLGLTSLAVFPLLFLVASILPWTCTLTEFSTVSRQCVGSGALLEFSSLAVFPLLSKNEAVVDVDGV